VKEIQCGVLVENKQ